MSQDTYTYPELLRVGTTDHYEDPLLYDFEYRTRRQDIAYYKNVVRTHLPQKQGRILELGCGTGRLLIPLVREGYQVTGLDRAFPMIQRCKQKFNRLPKPLRSRAQLIQADLKEFSISPSPHGLFDLILCPFHTFMHLYSLSEIEQCLRQVKAHMAPHARFVFDVLTPDIQWLAKEPTTRFSKTRFIDPTTQRQMLYSTNHIYDDATQVALIRIYYERINSQTKTFHSDKNITASKIVHIAHRQFFPQELDSLLHYNGFTIIQKHGNFSGDQFSSDSTQQIIHTMKT